MIFILPGPVLSDLVTQPTRRASHPAEQTGRPGSGANSSLPGSPWTGSQSLHTAPSPRPYCPPRLPRGLPRRREDAGPV